MGSPGDESRNDDSQASQLLAAALRPRELQTAPPFPLPSSDDQHTSNSSGGSSLHYHTNGLMPTQSQSLRDSQNPLYDEGSQKENTPAATEKRPDSSPRASPGDRSPRRAQADSYPSPPVDHVVSYKTSKEKPCPKASVSSAPSDHLPSPVKPNKAVSFVPPSLPASRAGPAATVPTKAMLSPRKVRSPSPASQDSFAGPLPEQDIAKAYIAQSKHFHIPLSQLGDDSQSVSEGEDGPPPVSSKMWSSPPHRRRQVLHSSPSGKVLVADTPSHSSHSNDSQSQSQSQPHILDSPDVESQQSGGDSQVSDFFPPGQHQLMEAELAGLVGGPTIDTDNENDYGASGLPPTQPTQSDASTQPSSSYERLLNQDPFAPIPATTQPVHNSVVTEETQAVDYSNESHPETDVQSLSIDHDFYNDNGQMVFPSVPSAARSADTARSAIPRGLIGLVAPHKRYRYQELSPTPGPSTQRVPTVATAATANTTIERPSLDETQSADISAVDTSVSVPETQPSDLSVPASIGSESIPPPPVKRALPTATHALQSIRARRSSPQIIPDSEETRIVPDSDPPIPPPDTPPAGPPTAESSPVKSRSRRGLQSEDEVLRTVTRQATAPSVSAIPEEEEEEEEDVPLAVTVQSAKAKGKRKAVDVSPEGSPTKRKPKDTPKSPRRANPTHFLRDHAAGSWKDVIIPSSDPQEQREDAVAQAKAVKPKVPSTPIAKSRRAPRQAKLAAREHLRESPSDEENKDGDVVMPDQAAEDDDKDTIPAEDEMDVDPPNTAAKRGSKRKRAASSSTTKKASSSRVPKEEASTPATRPTKRLKSSSASRIAGGTATRVFALWRNIGYYYPGTVRAAEGGGRYKIHFDDNDKSPVELKHMRLCRLHKGDHVHYREGQRSIRATVLDAPACDATGQHRADDEILISSESGSEERVPVQGLCVVARTISCEWADRVLAEDAIVPACPQKPASVSPTPDGGDTQNGDKNAANNALAKAGFVVTLAPQGAAKDKDKEALMAKIRQAGGVVFKDWTELFALGGDLTAKRWTLKAEDIEWKGPENVNKVFLISDDIHQKAKFLIALALGIPCISTDWLDAVKKETAFVDWNPYLLPAGFSDHLNTRISQLVDVDFGSCDEQLTEIARNPVPAKVFSGKKILCIAPQFVLKKNGNGNQAAEAVPRIILCMGAATVEAVKTTNGASLGLDKYDYIVVREESERIKTAKNCVDISWVKDCLITGRLLPVPKWSQRT
ncbi:hypothetical protein C8Q78DRAFT_1079362 [Trametes maxima]|nr:hypothetical protein C8Q78DRAFT_1079362 [Trametes maxima]